MDYESLCKFGKPVLFILYLYKQVGYASAIYDIETKTNE